MQPEDVIEQKEWNELSSAERLAVAPLAANESEFNLLKKMLQVATADDVPQVSDVVGQNIKLHLQAPAQKRFRFWYAAAVIAVAVGLFLLQPKHSDNVADAGPNTTRPASPSNATASSPVQIPTTDSIKTATLSPRNVPPKPKVVGNNQQSRDMVKVNTSVIANASLLAFVTEVY